MTETNEMIERVARAISHAHFNKKFYSRSVESHQARVEFSANRNWKVSVPEARAAIEALREPSADMLKRGCDACPPMVFDDEMSIAWKAMIDAALGIVREPGA